MEATMGEADIDDWHDARYHADTHYDVIDGIDRLDLVAGLDHLLTHAWSRLADAIDFAQSPNAPADDPNRWSIATHGVVDDIVMITRLIGPTNWRDVSMRFLTERFDWWTVVHERAGIAPQEFDRAEMQASYDRYAANQ
jgi:hypothetical protein